MNHESNGVLALPMMLYLVLWPLKLDLTAISSLI